MSKVAVCRNFLESYSDLPLSIQKQTREAIEQLIDNPNNGSLHVETICDAKDSRMRSARVNQEYRLIILKADYGDLYYLVWVDHHDEAYKWAQTHTITGQLLEESMPVTKARGKEYTTVRLFEKNTDTEILEIGVPYVMLPVIRQIENEVQLDDLKEFLPPPLFEDLNALARGENSAELVNRRRAEKERIFNRQFQELLDKDQWREVQTFAQPFSIGQIIRGKYVVEGLVGRDITKMRSAVYKVHDIDNSYTGNRAIKVFLQQDEVSDWAIANELAIRQHVAHENISRCFGADHLETTGEKFLILEYHEGLILSQLLQNSETGRLSLREVADICRQTLNGLARLQEAGFVQGQISLHNIVLDQKHCIKIVSFDHSGQPGPNSLDRLIESPFSPPDLVKQGRHFGQDTYALGVVVYKMLSGEMPDPHNPRLPTAVAKSVGDRWLKFVEKACQPELGKRFDSATAMLAAMPEGFS